MKQCDSDCFACPYDDCILDDDLELTELEISESEARDREAERLNCEADYEGKRAADVRRKESKRRSHRNNRGKELIQARIKRETHKKEIKAYNDRYYALNRDSINAKRRERRRLAGNVKRMRNEGGK